MARSSIENSSSSVVQLIQKIASICARYAPYLSLLRRFLSPKCQKNPELSMGPFRVTQPNPWTTLEEPPSQDLGARAAALQSQARRAWSRCRASLSFVDSPPPRLSRSRLLASRAVHANMHDENYAATHARLAGQPTNFPAHNYKKLVYRRGTARCVVSVEILPVATQQCRNYLYDKS